MSVPGWYPDPGGAPGRFRYWDGYTWSSQTTADPRMSPPAEGPGLPASGSRQQKGRSYLGVVLVAVAGLVVLALIVLLAANVYGNRSTVGGPYPSSTVSGWDDSSPTHSPTPPPSLSPSTPPPSAPTPSNSTAPLQDCPSGDPYARADHPSDGRVHGGGLSFRPVPGWDPPHVESGISWGYDLQGQRLTTEPGWFALLAVGELHRSDGFRQPQQAAVAVTSCAVTSGFYAQLSGSRQLWSKAVTVDGKRGWSIRTEVYVDRPELSVPGDVLQVVVVDLGDPDSLALFIGAVSIGDKARIGILNRCLADLKTP
ncbi:hypothetical protein GCM10009841_32340 [Microlunatus panaciterrae]|uniref:DUF2510 domain-containing protein n=1 Tax=Microlunatus panaciterrae TaxID=400768 RepID=A0ABS2RFW0_9ACTN|nr:DUF2510 domain-containing protein [Microlunatus panaciterrae]MBM7797893.1 hypothetical protein [Microlunatus panaciterrae]